MNSSNLYPRPATESNESISMQDKNSSLEEIENELNNSPLPGEKGNFDTINSGSVEDNERKPFQQKHTKIFITRNNLDVNTMKKQSQTLRPSRATKVSGLDLLTNEERNKDILEEFEQIAMMDQTENEQVHHPNTKQTYKQQQSITKDSPVVQVAVQQNQTQKLILDNFENSLERKKTAYIRQQSSFNQQPIQDDNDEINNVISILEQTKQANEDQLVDESHNQLIVENLVSLPKHDTRKKNIEDEEEEESGPKQNQSKKGQQANNSSDDKSKKHSMSIDRFRMMQFVKNPISSCNLIVLSLIYLSAIAFAFPLSYYGIHERSCNLQYNYRQHLIYLGLILLVLLPTDVYAFIFKERLNDILSHQSYLSTSAQLNLDSQSARPLSICSILIALLAILIQVLCTVSTVFELYSDLLIVWISLFSQLPFAFGFFALVFPLINRLLQLGVSVKMFIYGMRMKLKTIASKKIDRLVVLLGMFNVSSWLYHTELLQDYNQKTKNSEGLKKVLTFILIKEVLLKILQIVLKLILITPAFSKDCEGNFATLGLMIIGNLLSLMQMIFFVVNKYPRNEESDKDTLQQLDQYLKSEIATFEVTIDNKNQDLLLKHINAYLLKYKRKCRGLSISFQNQTKLLQPQYRDKFLKALAKIQQENPRIKSLKLSNCCLNLEDFANIRNILQQLPKIESLSLDNFELIGGQESECMQQLTYGLERNKRFRNLSLKFKSSNKKYLMDYHFNIMYNINKQLSILFIDEFKSPVELANEENQDETIYSLYSKLDLDFFVEQRRQFKNHKLFLFRDWENLLRRLCLQKSRNLNMSDLPDLSIDKQSVIYKRQKEMFILWVTMQIEKNRQLQSASIRFHDGEIENKENQQLSINIDQAQTIIDEIIANDSDNLTSLTMIYNMCEKQNDDLKQSTLLEKIISMTHLKELSLAHLVISPVLFHQLCSKLKFLSTLSLKDNNLQSIEGIEKLNLLEALTIINNPCLLINKPEQIAYLFRHLTKFEISHSYPQKLKQINNQIDQSLPDLTERKQNQSQFFIDFESIQLDGGLEDLFATYEFNKLQELTLKDNDINDEILNLIMKYIKKDDTLQLLNLSDNALTDHSIDSIMGNLIQRENHLKTLNLSGNQFTQEIVTMLKQNLVEEVILADCKAIDYAKMLEESITESCITKFVLSKEKEAKYEEISIQVNLKPFVKLQALDLGYLNLEQESILTLLTNLREFEIPINSLDISGSNVGYPGCKLINILAQRRKLLKSLKLDSSQITCLGLTYLWISFSDPDQEQLSLDLLSVQNNSINVGWARRLNYKLCQPLKVRHLDLSYNLLNDNSCKDLMGYFIDNKHLEHLDMSYNKLTNRGHRHLKELIWHNSNLRELILREASIEVSTIEMCERRMRAKENAQKIVYY